MQVTETIKKNPIENALVEFEKKFSGSCYDMALGEVTFIREKNENGRDIYECITDAFMYGFIKGQRAEKARCKKVKKAEAVI